jgi:hypothetical protein
VGALWMLGGLDYAAVTKNWWATTRLLWFIIYSHSASGLYRLLPSSPASSHRQLLRARRRPRP